MDAGPLCESPGVSWPEGFARRLERLALSRASERGEGEARAARRVEARGLEFAGYRAYRAGEDVRHLDWALLARLDRPFVREHAAAAGERWSVHVDCSGSMGLGEPGKLSAAAALALGLAAAGLRRGARTSVRAARPDGTALAFELARRADLARCVAGVAGLRAERGARVPPFVDAPRGRCERVFVLGDLDGFDVARLRALRARGRRVVAGVVIAPHERALPPGESARLVDRESGASLDVALAPEDRARYAAALSAHLAELAARARGAGVALVPLSSAAPFEDGVRALFAAAERGGA